MGCGCGKNKPKVNLPARNPVIVAQANQARNFQVRVNQQQVNPNIQATAANPNAGGVFLPTPPPVPQQQPQPAAANLSPGGLDAHAKKIHSLRREAIRRSLGR